MVEEITYDSMIEKMHKISDKMKHKILSSINDYLGENSSELIGVENTIVCFMSLAKAAQIMLHMMDEKDEFGEEIINLTRSNLHRLGELHAKLMDDAPSH